MSPEPEQLRRTVVYLKETEASVPRTGECLVGHWWVVHPKLGLMTHVRADGVLAPQCNQDEDVVEFYRYRFYPDHIVKYIPIVFMANVPNK